MSMMKFVEEAFTSDMGSWKRNLTAHSKSQPKRSNVLFLKMALWTPRSGTDVLDYQKVFAVRNSSSLEFILTFLFLIHF